MAADAEGGADDDVSLAEDIDKFGFFLKSADINVTHAGGLSGKVWGDMHGEIAAAQINSACASQVGSIH